MPEITFICPRCHQIIAPGSVACGEQIHCPDCNEPLVVPPQSEWEMRASREDVIKSSRNLSGSSKGSLWNFMWLILAFLPAVDALCARNGGDLMPTKSFWILNGIISFIAGFRFLVWLEQESWLE